MSPYTRLLLLSGALLILLLYLDCTSASFRDVSYLRVKKASGNKKITRGTKKPTAKPLRFPTTLGTRSTTMKPGASTTMAPGASTTMAPGSSTSMKPGSSTTMKPGSSKKPGKLGSSTTKKPGSSTTGNPNNAILDTTGGSSGEMMTTTRMPGEVIMVTKMPVEQFEGFDYLGTHNQQRYYVSQAEGTKSEAVAACANLGSVARFYDLVVLNDRTEFMFVTRKLDNMGKSGPFYINILIENRNGKEVMIMDGASGRELYILDDTNPDGIMTMRNKRETPILSYVHRRVGRAPNKHKGKSAGVMSNPNSSAAAVSAVGEPGTLITIIDTQYPWIVNWTGKPGGGECPSECKPTTCTVNTTECTATTVECQVKHTNSCKVITGGGECAMVCEKCDITSPECYVREPKCVVIKDRVCTIDKPDCQAVQGDCIVSRPECVSRQPPCNQTKNQAPECTLPEKCKTHQGMECSDIAKPCAEGEVPPCTYKSCKPLEICLTPEYCRYDQIICPPVETFCPPEIVKCPPPTVTCPEPNITCTDPEVYCPPPTVVCTKPMVNCTAPRVSCPNIVTQCPNPEIDCPSPTVDCPQPTVTCEQPTIPCPLPPIKWKDCAVECEGECNCVRIVKSGSEWRREQCKCDEKHFYICEGPEEKGSVVSKSPSQPPAKPPKKG